jgi:tRNA(Ile)-lysidine synthase
METQFLSYLTENNLISTDQPTLIAISGGADSVVLAQLYHRCKLPFSLVHCNFLLRGEQSDGDELFVRMLAKKYRCRLFTERFDTKDFAATRKISIEMAARELRYLLFDKIRTECGYHSIATAHHQDDNAETILLNLIRGTGLKGLLGIKKKSENHIIRPLLFANKAMIMAYVEKNKLSYRTDASNFDSIFKRNKLRNEVIPLLKEMNPSVVKTINDNASRITESYSFYQLSIQKELIKLINKENSTFHSINIEALQQTGYARLFLFEWLQPYGFNESNIDDINEALNSQSGKQFIVGDYILVKDRDTIVLSPKEAIIEPFTIEEGTEFQLNPIFLEFVKSRKKNIDLKHDNNNIAFVDAALLLYPLTVRHWEDGDSFIPLGMTQRKKVSDFLIDNKVPLYTKKQTFVMIDRNDTIVWVLGMRIADSVKVSDKTKSIIKIEFVNRNIQLSSN